VSGGTKFVLEGDGLTDETDVYFGSREADADLVRGALVGETPEAAGAGAVTVKALDSSTGRHSIDEGFTYTPTLDLEVVEPEVVPTRGGFQVTLHGSGFTDETRVSIDGKTAPRHDFVDDSTMRIVVPEHAAGATDVRLTNRDESTLAREAITYSAPLAIEQVRPTTGPPAGGTTVTVNGSGLTSDTTVRFGGEPASVVSVASDGTSATVETPAQTAGRVDVSAENADGDATLAPDSFYYAPRDAELTLASVEPTHGRASGGTELTLVGSGLDDSTLQVQVDGRPATVQSTGPGWAVATTPAHPVGTVDVTAQTDGAQSSLAGAFTYVPDLQVDALQPTDGTVAGGDTVTITGTGFTGTTSVRLGSIPASYTVVDDSTLELTTAARSAGTVDVVVERAEIDARLEDAFTYTAPLEVYGQSPSRGAIAGDTYVVVRGSGFTGEDIDVTFDGDPAPEVARLDSQTLAVRSPAHPAGRTEVSVERGGASATSPQEFAYFNPANRDGGTSGGPIRGAVNVSVYAGGGAPLEDAFVMLSTRPETAHAGRTDANGQITFGGPNLEGTQTITAAAPGYSTSMIQRVDAENVTLFLEQRGPIPEPPTPPSDAGMGADLDAGPTQDVNTTDTDASVDATPVEPRDVDDPPDDEQDASDDPDPRPDPPPPGPPKFTGELTGLDKLGLPGPNERHMAVVYTTREGIWSRNPDPGPNNRLYSNGRYGITTRIGELALVAVGGLYNTETGDFDAMVMGVRRYQYASRGETYERDIQLDIELDQTLTFKVEERPFHQNGPNTKRIQPYLDFGLEGIFGQLPAATGQSDLLEADDYPAFDDELSDLTVSLRGGAYTGGNGRGYGAPYSLVVERDLRQVDQTIPVSPLLGVPILSTPQPGSAPVNRLLDFELTGRHRPDLYRIQIYDGRTSVFEAFMPGSSTTLHLPTFPDMSSVPEHRRPNPYPEGRYFMRVTAIRTPSVSLGNFSYSDLSIDKWSAYAMNFYSIRL
jgi:hypothetical protein